MSNKELIDKIINHLEENPHLSLIDLSNIFDVDYNFLKNAIRYYKGYSFIDWKWNKVYELYTLGIPIDKIAKITGYVQPNHINDIIKRYCKKHGIDYHNVTRHNTKKLYENKYRLRRLCKLCNFSFRCLERKLKSHHVTVKKKLERYGILDWFYENAKKLNPDKYSKGERTKRAIELFKQYPNAKPYKVAKMLDLDGSYCCKLKKKITKELDNEKI